MLLSLLLACGSTPPATEPPAPPEPVVAPVAPAATPVAAPAADPAAYDDQVLVILSSALEPGVVPAGLDRVATTEGARPARLDSTWFKGLMPCYEIVVAGGFADMGDAKALSARLKSEGIDHYLKRAGRYVGPRPELARECAAMRSPAEGDARFALVEAPGARLITGEAGQRLLEQAPPLQRLDGAGTAWSAPLAARKVERWSVGDQVPGLTFDGGVETCTITGFAAGQTGQPHWSYEEGDTTAPACGTPAIYAQVDCTADLVLAPEVHPAEVTAVGEARDTALDPVPEAWKDRIEADRASAASKAEDEHVPLAETWTRQRYQVGGRELELVQIEIQTGEGAFWCGREDFYTLLVGLLDPEGQPLGPLRSIAGDAVQGIVDLDGSGAPRLVTRDRISGSVWILGASDSDDAVGFDVAYCDCPC